MRTAYLKATSAPPVDLALAVCLAAAVFAAAMGSSSFASVIHVGLPLRWAALGLLVIVALPFGLRSIGRLPPLFTGGLATLAAVSLLSTIWSVTPATTFKHAASFTALAVAAVLVAAGASRSRERLELVGGALLAAP
ncbi:MAG TPA: hypothetical protein VGM80_03780, partial [Gaiellaceae bacterium]